MIYFFGIEGNIGVGKSTMLKNIKKTPIFFTTRVYRTPIF